MSNELKDWKFSFDPEGGTDESGACTPESLAELSGGANDPDGVGASVFHDGEDFIVILAAGAESIVIPRGVVHELQETFKKGVGVVDGNKE